MKTWTQGVSFCFMERHKDSNENSTTYAREKFYFWLRNFFLTQLKLHTHV